MLPDLAASVALIRGDRTKVLAPYWILVVSLLIVFARGLTYTFAVPPWQHPDEPTHFERILVAAELGRQPALTFVSLPIRREIASSMLKYNFWHGIPQPALDDKSLSAVGYSPLGLWMTTQPPLYYAVAALWLRPWLGAPVEAQLYVTRLLSVLMNVLVVALTFAAARLVFGNREWLVIGVLAFIVFQPMYTDIMSAVNNDALANVLGAGLFAVLAWIYRRGPNLVNATLAVLIVIAALLTKSTAIILVGALVIGIICYLWRSWKSALTIVALSGLGCAMLVAGGVIWQRQAPQQFNQAVALVGSYFRIVVSGTLQNLVNPARLIDYRLSAITVFDSFWAAFGWRHILLSPGWYILLALVSLAALAGLLWLGLSRTHRAGEDGVTAGTRYLRFSAIGLMLAWLIAVVRGQADQGMALDYLSHGRYVFVAIVPFTLLFTCGLLGAIPERRRRFGVVAYLLCLVAFDAVCFWALLMPYYTCCRAV